VLVVGHCVGPGGHCVFAAGHLVCFGGHCVSVAGHSVLTDGHFVCFGGHCVSTGGHFVGCGAGPMVAGTGAAAVPSSSANLIALSVGLSDRS
jgi:hypothetical protein